MNALKKNTLKKNTLNKLFEKLEGLSPSKMAKFTERVDYTIAPIFEQLSQTLYFYQFWCRDVN